jgi:hypothetical protein
VRQRPNRLQRRRDDAVVLSNGTQDVARDVGMVNGLQWRGSKFKSKRRPAKGLKALKDRTYGRTRALSTQRARFTCIDTPMLKKKSLE